MTADTLPLNAIDGLLRLPDPVDTFGRAVWLYLALLASAVDGGIVLQTRANLARSLRVPETAIDDWLKRLVEAKLVAVQSPSPGLVLKLTSWSGVSPKISPVPVEKSEQSKAEIYKGPVYSNSNSSAAAAIALRKPSAGEGGPGEGDPLGSEIGALLPEAEPDEIALILANFPGRTIRKAIDRTEQTPPHRIRKSKTALFRFLLKKFSEDIDVNDL